MSLRCRIALALCGACAVAGVIESVHVTGQGVLRRMPDGRPDLEGVWSFVSATPLERPREFGNKAELTKQEFAELERRAAAAQRADGETLPPPGDTGWYNRFWGDAGAKRTDRRTSLISDPPDGRLPPVTPETQERMMALMTAESNPGHPEDLTPWGRCLVGFNAGPPILPSGYNNNLQVLQSRDTVVLFTEMVHEARMIPLDGRPHLPPSVRQWQGVSTGRWEADTLVIDTRNFRRDGTGNLPLLGAGVGGRLRAGVLTDENLHVVERFSRSDADTLRYEVTVDDPTVWTRPWTAVVLMKKTEDLIYEYACHEGNRAMSNILVGQRAAERR